MSETSKSLPSRQLYVARPDRPKTNIIPYCPDGVISKCTFRPAYSCFQATIDQANVDVNCILDTPHT